MASLLEYLEAYKRNYLFPVKPKYFDHLILYEFLGLMNDRYKPPNYSLNIYSAFLSFFPKEIPYEEIYRYAEHFFATYIVN
jgi:hypothetical protein